MDVVINKTRMTAVVTVFATRLLVPTEPPTDDTRRHENKPI